MKECAGFGATKEMHMNRLVIRSATIVAFALYATSAFATTAPLAQKTGPDLSTKIFASGDAGFATLNVPLVYGNTSPQAGHNVQFSGYTGFNGTTLTLGSATNISITGGNGFAQIADANYTNPSVKNPSPSTNDLFALLFNPDPNFSMYEFSIQLAALGTVKVYYDLATPGTNWLLAAGGPYSNGTADTQYIFGSASNLGLAVDQLLIVSTTAIKQVKQNSINLTQVEAPVPEPATWAMMLLGFGFLGAGMRRRRRSTAMRTAEL